LPHPIFPAARFLFAWDAQPQRVDELASDIRQIALSENPLAP
jgi:hypothetical protein